MFSSGRVNRMLRISPSMLMGTSQVARDLERVDGRSGVEISPESAIVKDTECGEIRTEGECGEGMEM